MQPRVPVSVDMNSDNVNEARNGGVSGKIEAFNGLADGNNIYHNLQSNQSKNGQNGDLPTSKISEFAKLGSLESASTHSLFSVVNNILDDSIERNNEDIPQRVASLLKLVVQELEQRVSKHADYMRKQNNLYKSREERYQSKIKALETFATGTTEENEVVVNQLQEVKLEKMKIEEKKKLEEQDLVNLGIEKDKCERQILALKEELTLAKKDYNENYSQLEATAEENQDKLRKTILELESQILSLKEEIAVLKKDYKENYFQLEAKAEDDLDQLQKKIRELESCLTDSSNKVQELEDLSESKYLQWKRKEKKYENFIDSHFQALQELRYASKSIKEDVLRTKNIYAEEFHNFGVNMKGLVDAAQSYHSVFEENRKLYNEVQDLKGNIRVYCRIKPFLPGKTEKQTTIQFIGEDGELVVTNPSKPGKDAQRLFKFNKVFSPVATQEDVFRDTQPLIRSVLDGYNVCIFAYGQTGSGKTYTMTGPNMTSVSGWGVNYRALNDLFSISQNRQGSVAYEVGVQMVEIYNEQVRDLLGNDNFQKKLGIWSTTQPNGLAVPDASVHPVKSTDDVLELMNVGLMNRAVGATALNERSSRSHSIVSVHVHGTDLETNGILHGCLHLVDLAGSERVDRSEVRGDRLREAQHINKSLSALGDVIFALAQKSSHVPYRNSKLTQVLQSSLGGRAKTLMFVQLNPDVKSYSETISTLKFAERVSGVELGAARSNKKGRGVAELMEQVASLKDAVSQKDDELKRLRLLKTNGNSESAMGSPRYGSASPSPRRHSIGPRRGLSVRKSVSEKAGSDLDNNSEYSDKHSEAGSQQSVDEFKHHRDFFRQSRLVAVGGAENFPEENELKFDFADQSKDPNEDFELLGFGEDDSEERLSDISDGVLSMGTETDCSINSTIVEYTLFPETAKPSEEITEKPNVPANLPRVPTKQGQAGTSKMSSSKSSSKIPSFKRATTTASSSAASKPSKRWQ